MAFRVIWQPKSILCLQDLPAHIADRVTRKVEQHLSQAPRQLGKPLVGLDYWSYRVGDYRVLYHIHDATITIFIIQVGHRKDIYD
jgi:mRNA interferase RelE/StbE